MDISDINKVANRKRMNADTEKLCEKVSRETAKIIKLKVAQDTAYWDLKEKLHQLENNHKRLQQNMVDMQMQHESISGQYQDELRLRPETLNKLSSTRKICDVLEDYSERLKSTLTRCTTNQAALYDAYQRSSQIVKNFRMKHMQMNQKNQQIIENLGDKVKLMNEHHNLLLECFNNAKQQMESELNNMKNNLTSTLAEKDKLVTTNNQLNVKLNENEIDIEKKEEMIKKLQKDMQNLKHEFNIQIRDTRNTVTGLEKDMNEKLEENEVLKRAIRNQEEFAKSLCDQKNQLQEKICSMEQQQQATLNMFKELETKYQHATSKYDTLNGELVTLNQTKEELQRFIEEKDQLVNTTKVEIDSLKAELATLKMEKLEIVGDLNQKAAESNEKTIRIENLTAMIQGLEMRIRDMNEAIKCLKDTTDTQIKELKHTVEIKNKELDSKASTITQLMSDVKNGTDARSKLEGTVQKLKREQDRERITAKEKEGKLAKQIEQLEISNRNKDDELSKHMSIILNLRNEKEKQQDKVQAMQNKIDNIQKELSGRPDSAPAPAERPELDDDAAMLTPNRKRTMIMPPSRLKHQKTVELVEHVERVEREDSMPLNMFSDYSTDEDMIDIAEVNRRFESMVRGETFTPVPLSALKRRRETKLPATDAGNVSQNNPVSLSQVKNEIRNKGRMFFKSKRGDNKTRSK